MVNTNPLQPISLGRLVVGITSARPHVLEQLSEAMIVAEHLDRTGDELIGHFVDEARAQKLSWSEIGRSMGVSKQAAQKRFTHKGADEELDPLHASQGFGRFTIEARNLLGAGHDAARARREPSVAAARLALMFADSPALAALGVSPGAWRAALEPKLPDPGSDEAELVPYDDDARAALEAAFAEAIRLEADMVDVRHVLIGLLSVEPLASLRDGLGLSAERVTRFASTTPDW